MKALTLLTASAALALTSVSAHAQLNQLNQGSSPAATSSADPVKRVTVEQLAKILQDAGYRAEIVQGSKNRYIRSGLAGRRIAIYMYDCKDQACGSYQFSAIFTKNDKYTPVFVNEWNKKRRYAKAYLDNDGDLNFEWDIDLDGGVTNDYLKTTILSFESYIGSFDKFTP
jgi:hypothetical protein